MWLKWKPFFIVTRNYQDFDQLQFQTPCANLILWNSRFIKIDLKYFVTIRINKWNIDMTIWFFSKIHVICVLTLMMTDLLYFSLSSVIVILGTDLILLKKSKKAISNWNVILIIQNENLINLVRGPRCPNSSEIFWFSLRS